MQEAVGIRFESARLPSRTADFGTGTRYLESKASAETLRSARNRVFDPHSSWFRDPDGAAACDDKLPITWAVVRTS